MAPETPIESRQSLETLSCYVSSALQRAPVEARTRDYLVLLWRFLQTATGAAEGTEAARRLTSRDEREEDNEDEKDARFSHRQLARALGIPRERLPGLFAMLREWLTEAEAQARAAKRPPCPSDLPSGRRSMPSGRPPAEIERGGAR